MVTTKRQAPLPPNGTREQDTFALVELEQAPLCDCGHGAGAHYNLRSKRVFRNMPCHKLGRHDMRCTCRNYSARLADGRKLVLP